MILAWFLRVFHLVLPLFSQNFSLTILTVFIAGMLVIAGFLYSAIIAIAIAIAIACGEVPWLTVCRYEDVFRGDYLSCPLDAILMYDI
ncbi:hypothetical protein [Serratia ureilytica]|uniref:hypothetical protein n=1 Tax=Serratia ureilytica TaxID=300181 RepID=UPI001C10B84E|nr:hypothetical protein [Serratia ureilytica]MBU5412452.1 hypothetical protein [Serratia ureilytica]